MSKIQTAISTGLIATIAIYQKYISPLLGSRCRFYPSCSEYAKRALLRYGLQHGGKMALVRLARCHPFSVGGVDELPNTDITPLKNADLEGSRLAHYHIEKP